MTKPAEITLTLSLDEVNAVLQLVANGPFAQVHALIAKIRAQAEPQVTPQPEPSAKGDD